jgi:hypothetical protein
MHCPTCHQDYGDDSPATETIEPESVEEITAAEVEIAKIQANRDIKLAQIGAGVAEHVAEVDQAAELGHAEGKAEGLEEAITPPEPEPSETPVVVVGDSPPPEEPEITPPPADESSEPPEPKSERHGYGNPGWFG